MKEARSLSIYLKICGLLKSKFDYWNAANFNPIKSTFMSALSVVIFNYSLNDSSAIYIVEADELAHLLAIYKDSVKSLLISVFC